MIPVDGDTYSQLHSGKPKVRPRITWEQGNLGGTVENSIDLSDRLLGELPPYSISTTMFLGGVSESRQPIRLRNDDRVLSPLYTSADGPVRRDAGGADEPLGLFGNRNALERQMAKVTVELGVEKKDGSIGYVPCFGGYVDNMEYRPGSVEFDIRSPLSMLGGIQIPEDYVILPNTDGTNGDNPSTLIQTLATDNSPLDGVLSFDETWDTLDTTYQRMDWAIGGRIRAGGSLSSAIDSLARSGLAVVVPHEDGRLRLVSDLPEQFTRRNDHYGDLIDSSNAGNWTLSESIAAGCTSVSVAYNSVSIAYPTSVDAAEADIGKQRRMIPCPYIYLGRTAWLAAYILYTQHATIPQIHTWTMDLRGILIQVGDRVRINNPIMNNEQTARVVAKGVTTTGTAFSAVVEGHESDIIQGTFAEWESTTWGDGTELLL